MVQRAGATCNNQLFIALFACILHACGKGDTHNNFTNDSFSANNQASLPECDAGKANRLAYVIDEKKFYVCNAVQWKVIDVQAASATKISLRYQCESFAALGVPSNAGWQTTAISADLMTLNSNSVRLVVTDKLAATNDSFVDVNTVPTDFYDGGNDVSSGTTVDVESLPDAVKTHFKGLSLDTYAAKFVVKATYHYFAIAIKKDGSSAEAKVFSVYDATKSTTGLCKKL